MPFHKARDPAVPAVFKVYASRDSHQPRDAHGPPIGESAHAGLFDESLKQGVISPLDRLLKNITVLERTLGGLHHP